jgi:hypothetical protein
MKAGHLQVGSSLKYPFRLVLATVLLNNHGDHGEKNKDEND